uniref:Cleavage and polyadenylation specificity factor subunit 2 n=1 Tax=Lygus hesperus TaxID=30085 RepID=A0A0A9WGD9_LYGHE
MQVSIAPTDAYLTKNPAQDQLPILLPLSSATSDGVVQPSRLDTILQQKYDRPSIFIGDLRLSDLQSALVRYGIPVFLQHGILFCGADGLVTIRRTPDQCFAIEGILSDTLYRVRDILYNQFQIV